MTLDNVKSHESDTLVKTRKGLSIGWYLLICLLIMLIPTGIWTWFYVNDHLERGRYVDERPCQAQVSGEIIKGTRFYSYPYTTVFGYRLIDTTEIEMRTQIELTGSALTVIAQQGERYWAMRGAVGERGIKILKQGEFYTFVTDKGVVQVKFEGFCGRVGKKGELAEE